MPNKKCVSAFSLNPDVVVWLDSYSRSEGVSKSYIVRELLSWLMKEIGCDTKLIVKGSLPNIRSSDLTYLQEGRH